MSIATFVEALFLLLIALLACMGVALLIDHWRSRKLHRNVRAYEGLADADWLSRGASRETSRDAESSGSRRPGK